MSLNSAANSVTTWSPDFIADGITTIVWGTEGLLSSYIVVTGNENQRVDEIRIEQGAGFTAIIILLIDGNDVEIEVVDDTAVNPPAVGTVVTLSTPYGNIPMLTCQTKAGQARKREGMRTFTFRSFNGISGLH
jgi:hypothetical protein